MFPSEHADPSVALVCAEHCPVVGLHVPITLHVAAAGHVTGLAPTHEPLWHESVCVHAFPSEHVVPLGALVCAEHVPDVGSHVPATLHIPDGHTVAGPGAHAPLWQVSPTVQALPSVQVVPFADGMHDPVAAAQV
jgi:hypothetical protein